MPGIDRKLPKWRQRITPSQYQHIVNCHGLTALKQFRKLSAQQYAAFRVTGAVACIECTTIRGRLYREGILSTDEILAEAETILKKALQSGEV